MIKLLAIAVVVVAVATALGAGGLDIRAGASALRNVVTSIGSPVNSQGDEQDGDRDSGEEPDAQDADQGESPEADKGSEP